MIPAAPDSHFPIQNLPFGVFRPRTGAPPRVGVAIGEQVLDLSVLESRGLFHSALRTAGRESLFYRPSLNAYMAQDKQAYGVPCAVD